MAGSDTNDRTLLVRADASTEIGAGHVMRCLALAQAWRAAGGKALFATATDAPGIRQRLGDEGFETVRLAAQSDADATSELAREVEASWIVVDGYHLDSEYRRCVQQVGHRVLYIDDCGDVGPYEDDVVLNQNAYACDTMYPRGSAKTRLLLGARYVLLRAEFLTWREHRRNVPDAARKLLVTLGGGDADNVTGRVLDGLNRVDDPNLEVVVLVGGANPHREAVVRAAATARMHVRVELNRTQVAELMAWADLAVSAGGSTCWELAFMGLPTIMLVVADNQRRVAESVEAAGAGRSLGWFHDVAPERIGDAITDLARDPDARRAMSAAGRSLVDGNGAGRVVSSLRDYEVG